LYVNMYSKSEYAQSYDVVER